MAWQNSQRAYRWRCVPIAWAWWRAPRGPRGGEAGGGRGMPRDGTEPVARAPRAFSSLHSSYFTLHKFTVVFCHSERRLLWRWDEKRTIDKVCLYVAVADNKCCVHFHLCECYDPYLFVCFFWLPPHGSAITFKLTLYFETMERCSYGFYTKRYFILFLKAFFIFKIANQCGRVRRVWLSGGLRCYIRHHRVSPMIQSQCRRRWWQVHKCTNTINTVM